MDLSEFITARLDEDEAAAKAVTEPGRASWVVSPGEDEYGTRGILSPAPEWDYQVASYVDADTALHIARHDPARALREVAAKRRILAEVVGQIDEMDSRIEGEWGSGYRTTGESDLLLALLALPYSDHLDYQPEWAPAS